MGGVARRNWSRNPNAMEVAVDYNQNNDNEDQITIPFRADDVIVKKAAEKLFAEDV